MRSWLRARLAGEGSEGWWNAEKLHAYLGGPSPARITSEPLLPTESGMRSLRAGEGRQSSGREPTANGCRSTLTWRGFAVAPPFH